MRPVIHSTVTQLTNLEVKEKTLHKNSGAGMSKYGSYK